MNDRRTFREPGSVSTPPVVQPLRPGRTVHRDERRPRRRRPAPPPSTTGAWAMLVGCALGMGLVVVLLVATGHLQPAVLLASLAGPVLQLWAVYLVCLMACRRAQRER